MRGANVFPPPTIGRPICRGILLLLELEGGYTWFEGYELDFFLAGSKVRANTQKNSKCETGPKTMDMGLEKNSTCQIFGPLAKMGFNFPISARSLGLKMNRDGIR